MLNTYRLICYFHHMHMNLVGTSLKGQRPKTFIFVTALRKIVYQYSSIIESSVKI